MQAAVVGAEVASALPSSFLFRAQRKPSPRESVLRLAILIADAAGEILFWNLEAEQAVARLAGTRPVGGLLDIFSAEVLDRLQAGTEWVAVKAPGAGDVGYRVRAHRQFDSGRSMLLLYPDVPDVVPS